MIKLFYAGFLGLMLTLFVSYGVSVFYTEPVYPEYPIELNTVDPKGGLTTGQKAIQKQYEADQKTYDEDFSNYSRNVALIIVGLSVALLGLGVMSAKKVPEIADGILLSGVMTLFYGVIRAMMVKNDDKIGFAILAVAVLTSIALGYWKFVLPNQKSPKKT